MTQLPTMVKWSGKPLLAPFSWAESCDILVPTDIFAQDGHPLYLDELFAVMALCPRHQFCLVTAFPDRFHDYVRTITEDEGEWLTWRVTASHVLDALGRGREAKGRGPVWPLKNVALADFKRVLN